MLIILEDVECAETVVAVTESRKSAIIEDDGGNGASSGVHRTRATYPTWTKLLWD